MTTQTRTRMLMPIRPYGTAFRLSGFAAIASSGRIERGRLERDSGVTGFVTEIEAV
jgi:hypothetical protein